MMKTYRNNGGNILPEGIQYLCLSFYWLNFQFTRDRPEFDAKHPSFTHPFSRDTVHSACAVTIGNTVERIAKYEWIFEFDSDITFEDYKDHISIGLECVQKDQNTWDKGELNSEFYAAIIKEETMTCKKSVGLDMEMRTLPFEVEGGDHIVMILDVYQEEIRWYIQRGDTKYLERQKFYYTELDNAYLAVDTAGGRHSIVLREYTITQSDLDKPLLGVQF